MSIRESSVGLLGYAVVVAALLGVASSLHAATFLSVKPADIPSFSATAFPNAGINLTAISGDGRTIAGQVYSTGVIYDCVRNSCGIAPYTWSLDDSAARSLYGPSIPLNPGTFVQSAPPYLTTALSQDGKSSLSIGEFRRYEAAIVKSGQPTLLRPVVDSNSLWAAAMSADAGIVVGNLGDQSVRWTAATGLQPITGLPSDLHFSAQAISGDGHATVLNAQPSRVAGIAGVDLNSPKGNAYLLTATGLTELSQIAGDHYSAAVALSFDGSTIVGNSVSDTQPLAPESHAVRWHQGALLPLALLSGFNSSNALDVSGDGSRIVGTAFNAAAVGGFPGAPAAPTGRAVIWDANGQVIDLKALLETQYGLGSQLSGWQLTSASGISDDGRVIAGVGTDPQGNTSVWIAELPVPEPASTVLSITAIALLCGQSSRSRRRRTQR